jgi:hypothetical protein
MAMSNVTPLKRTQCPCDCFNCEISREIDEFDVELKSSGDFTDYTGDLLQRLCQIAESPNVSKKQRLKALHVIEKHSKTVDVIMGVLKDVHKQDYPDAVLHKCAEFIEYWTGRKAVSAFH